MGKLSRAMKLYNVAVTFFLFDNSAVECKNYTEDFLNNDVMILCKQIPTKNCSRK